MTSTMDEHIRSPWLTVWSSPRDTIEQIVARRPGHLVWALAILAYVALLYGQIVSIGAQGVLADWRFGVAFLLICGIGGPVGLCLSALILGWASRVLGGQASQVALRAVIAWSAVPNILGLPVILIVGAAAGGHPAMRSVQSLLVGVFALWSTVVLLLMLARVQHFGFWRTITANLLVVVFAMLIILPIRTLLYQPFSVPSSSMAPTLLAGDQFFVEKFAYGYSRYSFPLSLPSFSGRLFSSEPKRGDVVAFVLPKDGVTVHVKRIVGLPGDRIQMKQGRLFINDTAAAREPIAAYDGQNLCGDKSADTVRRWRETLPDGPSFETLDCVDNGFYDNTNVYSVPAGYFFVLGDNRDNSSDSRVLSAIGYIPLENMIGRARMIYFSSGGGTANAPSSVRLERLATLVH